MRSSETGLAVAVDIGGTFTDIVLRGSDGSLTVDKTLTTPKNLLEGFFTGVHAVLTHVDVARAGFGFREIAWTQVV